MTCRCGAGALSAAAGSFAGPLMSGLSGVSKLVAHAVVGGIASVAGGGKFENGAVTAAFGYMFNAMAGQALGGIGGGYFGSALGAGLAGLCATLTGGACAPAAPYIVGASAAAGRWGGGIAGSALEDWLLQDSAPPGGRRLPDDRIIGPPRERGAAPIGDDGYPVELHHRGQRHDSPLDEMTRTDHRGSGNFGNNHNNTGQSPSLINRETFNAERRAYWAREWDSGRFDRFLKR